MFYKLKSENYINLEGVAIVGSCKGYYYLIFKGDSDDMYRIEKEDYEGIIKHLNCVNEGENK